MSCQHQFWQKNFRLEKSEKSNLNIISQEKYNIQFDFQTQKPYTENIKRVPATGGVPLEFICW